jgi:hypothetical protein
VDINDPGRCCYGPFQGRNLVAGDLDGDGADDLLLAPSLFNARPEQPIQIWVSDRRGGFRDATAELVAGPVLLTGSANNIFIRDFNGDARGDVLIIDQGLEYPRPFLGQKNHLLLSGADGKLHDASATLPGAANSFNHVSTLADVDGDACLDVLVSELPLGVVGSYLLQGDCRGGFTKSIAGLPREIAEHPTAAETAGVDYQWMGSNGVADLDDDGDMDLVTGSYQDADPLTGKHTVRIFANDGGTFAEASRFETPAAVADEPYVPGGAGRPGVSGIAAADLDGDDRPELAILWESCCRTWTAIYHNDGGLRFSDVTATVFGAYETTSTVGEGDFPSGSHYLRLEDVNRDGHVDLVLARFDAAVARFAGDNFLYLNDGAGKLRPFRFTRGGREADLAEVAGAFPAGLRSEEKGGHPEVLDANGDGVLDIVMVKWLSGNLAPPFFPSRSRIFTFLATPPR